MLSWMHYLFRFRGDVQILTDTKTELTNEIMDLLSHSPRVHYTVQ